MKEEVGSRFDRVDSPKLKELLSDIVFDAKKKIHKDEMERKLRIVQEVKESRPLVYLTEGLRKKTPKKLSPSTELQMLYYSFLKKKNREQHLKSEMDAAVGSITRSIFNKTQTMETPHKNTLDSVWGFNSTQQKVSTNSNLFKVKCHIKNNKDMSASPSRTTSNRFFTRTSSEIKKDHADVSVIGARIERGIREETILRQLPEYKTRVAEMASRLTTSSILYSPS